MAGWPRGKAPVKKGHRRRRYEKKGGVCVRPSKKKEGRQAKHGQANGEGFLLKMAGRGGEHGGGRGGPWASRQIDYAIFGRGKGPSSLGGEEVHGRTHHRAGSRAGKRLSLPHVPKKKSERKGKPSETYPKNHLPGDCGSKGGKGTGRSHSDGDAEVLF